MHADQLIPAYLARATHLENSTGMQLLNTPFSKKEDKFNEIAQTFLSCGKIREFCEIQFELGNHAKAMAFAPGVSIEYWQELADRRAQILIQEESEEAACAAIVANQVE